MKTSKERLEYARQYRIINKEKIREKDRERCKKGALLRRKHAVKGRKCEFCGRMLWSPRAGAKAQRYCRICREDPEIRRYLYSLYRARWYAKKKGQQQPAIKFAEDIVEESYETL